jgi:hypothetical protein
MTLEEYRMQVIERIRVAKDSVLARDVLSEVDMTLTSTCTSAAVQRDFWQALHEDLDVLADDSRFLEKADAARIGGIAIASQTWIEQNHLAPL